MKYLMWKDKGIIEGKFHSYSRGPEKKEENTDATSSKFPYSKTVWGFLKVNTYSISLMAAVSEVLFIERYTYFMSVTF